jgi:hypothetical protein
VYYANVLYTFVVPQARRAYRVRLGRLSGEVPAIVFGYPRHSGATDEGMTNGPPIFAYLVSVQEGSLSKGSRTSSRPRSSVAQELNLACKKGPEELELG